MFEEIIGIQGQIDDKIKINKREAVRAVILKGKKLVMMQTNKGDYKFPGGGLEKGENNIEALKREVKEETGYNVIKIGELLGKATERRRDIYEDNTYFVMNSYYYVCEIGDEKGRQNLDEYEKEQQFTVKNSRYK